MNKARFKCDKCKKIIYRRSVYFLIDGFLVHKGCGSKVRGLSDGRYIRKMAFVANKTPTECRKHGKKP